MPRRVSGDADQTAPRRAKSVRGGSYTDAVAAIDAADELPYTASDHTVKGTSDTNEIALEELQFLLDESIAEGGPGLPGPSSPMPPPPPPPTRASRAPQGKRKPALPLPAPSSRSESAGVAPPRPRRNRRARTERPTLAGSMRGRRQKRERPTSESGLSRVPRAIDSFDQSTAVSIDPLAAMQTPLVGGRYRIVERIGVGGMGKVFKVTHSQLGKTFALKIISDTLASEDKILDAFYREARMASSLSHPNIASVVDFGEDEDLGVFMVMEFLQGEHLAKLLHREKRLGVRQAAALIRQIAEALGYIHSNGIVHCDIKSENIFLIEPPGSGRRQLQVKLLDFGLARSTTAGRNSATLSGTPHYVAPERIRGEQPSPATDIYGLGILFYEMLTGRVPWDGTIDEILDGHLDREPTPPSQLVEEGVDSALDNLILRALAKNPAKRHRDCSAFLYELKTAMEMLDQDRVQRRGPRRIVARPTNRRDATARAIFDASRVPMALIGRDGVILVANAAFAQFLMGVAMDVEGLNIQATPLAGAWMSFPSALEQACNGVGCQQNITVDSDERSRRLLMWLDPGLQKDQAIFGVHPLDE